MHKLWRAIGTEAKAIFTNSTILMAMVGGVLFYAFLYPLPYQHQSPEEQKITVVDLDKSDLSRKFIRMVNSSQQVNVVDQAESVAEAKNQFMAQKVSGFLVIPTEFSKNVLLGQSPTVAYAGDASYFLVYGTIIEGLMKAGGTISAEIRVANMTIDGIPITQAVKTFQPFNSNYIPVFNHNMGYQQYVVPAVFVLILQQTLLMAVGVRQKIVKPHEKSPKIMLIRFSLFLCVELVLACFYFGSVFDFYDISRFSHPLELLILLVPFLTSVILLGFIIGELFPNCESLLLVVLFSSMPIVFSAGFIWPVEMIPSLLVSVMHLLPSDFAINGFLLLNQQGSGLQGVMKSLLRLYGLSAFYLLVYSLIYLKKVKNRINIETE